jgi:hypothetical protein
MAEFITNPIVSLRTTPINTQQLKCRKYKGFLPNLTPTINSLSSTISAPGVYALVYVNGENFTPYNISITFGTIQNIPIVFYSSFLVSFLVPLDVSEGIYNVQVVINNNNNLTINSLLYSNTVNYTIQNYNITGNYSMTDTNLYNTIITFTGNGEIFFYNTFNINWVITGNASVIINGKTLINGTYKSIINSVYYVTIVSGSVTLIFNV